MKVVIDANIIISAILGSKVTNEIIVSEKYELYAPRMIFSEIVRHREEISDKSGINEAEFYETLSALAVFIKLVDYINYQGYIEKAKEAIGRRDIKDSDYIACALEIDADFIWSNDKDFSVQNDVEVKNTSEVMRL
ncbi:MAG: putative toxin-antitoxin system toxin component, PIN family [Nanoarchaeota archaeon]